MLHPTAMDKTGHVVLTNSNAERIDYILLCGIWCSTSIVVSRSPNILREIYANVISMTLRKREKGKRNKKERKEAPIECRPFERNRTHGRHFSGASRTLPPYFSDHSFKKESNVHSNFCPTFNLWLRFSENNDSGGNGPSFVE